MQQQRARALIAAAMATAAAGALAAGIATAAETIGYRYDARGRLVGVDHSGSVNANVVANYSYDRADNRTNLNVTGTP